QRVNRPTESKIKGLQVVWEDAVKAHPQLSESSPPERKGREQGMEGKGEAAPAKNIPPADPKPLKRATRLPKDWKPDTAQITWARAERRDIDVDTEIEKFK